MSWHVCFVIVSASFHIVIVKIVKSQNVIILSAFDFFFPSSYVHW